MRKTWVVLLGLAFPPACDPIESGSGAAVVAGTEAPVHGTPGERTSQWPPVFGDRLCGAPARTVPLA